MTAILFVLTLPLSAPPESPPLVRATVSDKCVYSSGLWRSAAGESRSLDGGRLWIMKRSLQAPAETTLLDGMLSTYQTPDALHRWKLIDGRFYFVSYGPWGAERASSVTGGTLRTVSLAAVESVNSGRQKGIDFDNRRNYFLEELIEVAAGLNPIGVESRAMIRGEAYAKKVYFDIWSRGRKEYEVYVAAPRPDGLAEKGPDYLPLELIDRNPHKYNRLVRADFRAERQTETDVSPNLLWETVGDWTYDWDGPFYVATCAADRFFGTEAGRIFAPPANGKAGTPLKEVWAGKPPVDALIHDSDSAKWYAFTKDQYFEVADPIKPKPHTLTIQRSAKAEDALDTAARCARVIRGLPEPKRK
ncbi:MAG TPA: hypothetical protein VM597_35620 [Gemmataceae bacterium]|nr:hypothetical protein [Gemmataceae bacterium]